jgi:hypothetical protein
VVIWLFGQVWLYVIMCLIYYIVSESVVRLFAQPLPLARNKNVLTVRDCAVHAALHLPLLLRLHLLREQLQQADRRFGG